jgi:pimeloyl-ACP methyl ester carboxylesterase
LSTIAQTPETTDLPGSVARAPRLPAGFAEMFASRLVDTGDAVLHAVVGGEGPPLLLVAGWPQNWFAWRHLMPALARSFTVVAADPRGVNLSQRTAAGFDTATLATDLVGLMDALGYEHFAMIGHDVGMWIGYALAADHPRRLARLVVAEAAIPGISPIAPGLAPAHVNDKLWHFGFNRLDGLNEALVLGREDLFFGWQFAAKAATELPEYAVDYYVETIARDPDALRCSFEFYRAIDETMAQNAKRGASLLTLPVLAIGGAQGLGEAVGETMRQVASDVTSVSLDDCGHYPAEENPEAMLKAVETFLLPDH